MAMTKNVNLLLIMSSIRFNAFQPCKRCLKMIHKRSRGVQRGKIDFIEIKEIVIFK